MSHQNMVTSKNSSQMKISYRLLMIAIITCYALTWSLRGGCGGQLVGTSTKRLIRSNSLPKKLKDRDIDLPSLGECIGCGEDMYNSRYCTHFNCPTIKHYMHQGCAEKWCNQPNSNGRCPTCRAEATAGRWSRIRQSVIQNPITITNQPGSRSGLTNTTLNIGGHIFHLNDRVV